MQLFLGFGLILFSSIAFAAHELHLHRIWIMPDGSIEEGNYPGSLLGDTTTQTKLNMDAYDIEHRSRFDGLQSRDYAVAQLKNLLPSKKNRSHWRWDASKDQVYIDTTLPKTPDEKTSDLYSIIASTEVTKTEKMDALLEIEIIKTTNRINARKIREFRE